jgi:hypothetical protein
MLLAGCASPARNAIFVTKSSMSVVDADSTPPSISIGYDRLEGYMGPRYPDGTIFPVASAIETNGSGANRLIKQVYATGNAARIVTRQTTANVGSPQGETATATVTAASRSTQADASPAPAERPVVFFGTNTSAGLKLGFAEGTPIPNSFNFGYKRKEFSMIPVDPGREPSVLGTFNNAAGLDKSATAATGQFDVEQYFATGDAATNLAGLDSIQSRFRRKAEEALGDVAKFRLREAAQARTALDIVSCLTRVTDANVPEVWINARHLGIFRDLNTEALAAGKPVPVQRQLYLQHLPVAIDPDSSEYSDLLALHRKIVCKIAG